jgi:pyridoxamine 5'-phosphate oxidase
MDLYKEALAAFADLFERAKKSEPAEPNAMTLATAGLDARPHARVVLLKEFDARGFVFYTNTTSRKGQQLSENPHAALAFYWKSLERQVHIEGSVTPVTPEEADAYWSTRARVSQIGGWASLQSEKLDERRTLEKRVRHFEKMYEGKSVPRPPHWSGFRVAPERIELWKAEPHRLHQRTVYERAPSGWTKFLLYP